MELDSRSLLGMGITLNGGSNFPVLGLSYGSREEGRDVDLFYIFRVPVKKNIVNGNYDLSQIELNDFQFRVGNWDIEYTEPILTGDYLFGDKEILERARKFLETEEPTSENRDYIGKRALETYLQAERLLSEGKEELFNERVNGEETFKSLTNRLFFGKGASFSSPIISKSLSLLTYSLSYLASRERYSEGKEAVTLRKMLDSPKSSCEVELRALMEYSKSRRECFELEIPVVDEFFENTKNLLIKEAIH